MGGGDQGHGAEGKFQVRVSCHQPLETYSSDVVLIFDSLCQLCQYIDIVMI